MEAFCILTGKGVGESLKKRKGGGRKRKGEERMGG